MLQYLFKRGTRMLNGSGLGKFSTVGKIYRFMARKLLPEFITIEGNKIFLDSEDSINLAVFGLEGYLHEQFELSLFKSEISEGATVVDVGANVGVYTLVAAEYASKVYSFEPDPVTMLNLKRNIEENFYRNVITVNKAVSDKSGPAQFSSSGSKTGRAANCLVKDEKDSQDLIRVEAVSLDDYFKDIKHKIDMVKIDTNGAEFEVIRGMRNIIEENKNIRLFFEFYPPGLVNRGTDIPQFLDYLDNLNLKTYYIDEQNRATNHARREWLIGFSKKCGKNDYINLICRR